jgi:GR25 family glycosyltransferase involved in LPS biosynthesis
MNSLNEIYEKIVCISLKEREDKYNFMLNQFKKYNINAEFYRPIIYGYANKFLKALLSSKIGNFNKNLPNELGAFQSHYHVIKTALLEGVKNLFVFEDDCLFHKKWDDLLPSYLDLIPNDADGILLYSFQYDLYPQNIRINKRWTKGYKSWSLIAYGMNRKAMQKYIEILDSYPKIADSVTYEMMENGFNFYIASPPLIIPSAHSSNIRIIKNYEMHKSIYLLGIDENKYN